MDKYWRINQKAPADFLAQFPEYSPIVLQLLWDRGLNTQKQIDEFFNPDYDGDIHDPFLLKDCGKAVNRILKAVEKQEKILIYGDYDCDGVCGTVILRDTIYTIIKNRFNTFVAIATNVLNGENRSDSDGGPSSNQLDSRLTIYLPDRELEGYGLNVNAVQKFAAEKVDLMITIDCGISNYAEIELAKKSGMDVIVIDHHAVPPRIPRAYAVINPHQKDDKYPFKTLAGAGVAFKVASAILEKSRVKFSGGKSFSVKIKKGFVGKNNSDEVVNVEYGSFQPGWEKWLLDLVALATVTDCMPLLGENRTLVKYGLIVLAQTRRKGLQELMKIARISPSLDRDTLKTNLNHRTLGFMIGPRLNAAGRMDHANTAYQLLITDSQSEARELAHKLDQQNKERQRIVDEMVTEIESRLDNRIPHSAFSIQHSAFSIPQSAVGDQQSAVSGKRSAVGGLPLVIFEGREDWMLGLVGVAAGRIAEKYWRPTFIFRRDKDFSHGSGRSIPQFNLIEAMQSCSNLLEKFGGHPGAGGFTVKNENLQNFQQCLADFAQKNLSENDLTPFADIDTEVASRDISWELFDWLEKFEPFGQANEKPKFSIKDMLVKDLRTVGNNGKHLKLVLEAGVLEDKKDFKAIWFCPPQYILGRGSPPQSGGGAPPFCQGLKIGDTMDMVFELDVDEWNGNRELSLKIVDSKQKS